MNTLVFWGLTFGNRKELPLILKGLSVIGLLFLLTILGYWLIIQPNAHKYQALLEQEAVLKNQFEVQQQQAGNFQAYLQQLRTIKKRFGNLLKQLPSQNEMPCLLEDISKTGISSGLSFELFAPQPELAHDFYIEMPINLSVVGNYNQFAVFLSRIAQMDRIVTPHDFEITRYATDSEFEYLLQTSQLPVKQTGLLMMKMQVKVYWARSGDSTRQRPFSLLKAGIS